MNYHWNWSIFFEMSPEGGGTYLDMLLRGIGWTLLTALAAWTIAFGLGVAIGALRTVSPRGRRIASVYIELFRNIPVLMQLFLWFFVFPELLPQDWARWVKSLYYGPFYTAAVGLGLYMAARVATQVAAGIEALPRGQRMAGTALGFTTAQTYGYILLPMGLRVVMPTLTSELIGTIKNTSVALTIGLVDLTAAARAMQEFSFQVFEPFMFAACVYLLLNSVVTLAMRTLEQRLAVPGMISGK